MSAEAQVVLRVANEADRPFILSTYLKGQFFGSDYYKHMGPDAFYKEGKADIESILALPQVLVHVACLEDDPSLILGFLIFSPHNVIWCHVKKDYRSKGICNFLLKDLDARTFSNYTKAGLAIAKKKGLTFNPFNRGNPNV